MRILIIEDEPKLAAALKRGLQQEGYAADVVADGPSGLSYAADADYDLVILDRLLPGGMDGATICAKLRQQKVRTPIIMLTALGQIDQRVEGLNAGADDYLVKPFAFEELLARVRALLRRPPAHEGIVLRAGGLSLDATNSQVKLNGKAIALSKKEFSLLEYLLRNQGRVVSKEQIINHVWDESAEILPNTVEVHIRYLRKKIDKSTGRKSLIKTVRGFGYQINGDSDV